MPTTHSRSRPDPTTWGLTPATIQILLQEPDLWTDLAHSRTLPPLPPGYVPRVVEVSFEDVPFIRSEAGKVTLLRDCNPTYAPRFVEYRFDDETAVFQVGGEYVVNRIDGIAEVIAQLDLANRDLLNNDPLH